MDVLAIIKDALAEECSVDPDRIVPEAHLLEDLEIDSLDLLNATFRIEQDCGIKVPVQAWIELEYGETRPERSPFLISSLLAFLEQALAERAISSPDVAVSS
jgi:acyl carrier protein